MTLEILSFSFGALLILVGILGGGFEAKEIKIPKVTSLVRFFSMAIGLLFVLIGFFMPNQNIPQENIFVSEAQPNAVKEQIKIIIQDELEEYQMHNDYEGQTVVRLNGRNVGSITVNTSFPKSSLTASLPDKGQYRYVIEGKGGWNENGSRTTFHCVGDGAIDATAGKRFKIEGRLVGDKCIIWLEEI